MFAIPKQCWDETGDIDISRLSAGDQGPYCTSYYSCSKCECPDGNVEGDEWCHIHKYGYDDYDDHCIISKSDYTCESDQNGNMFSIKNDSTSQCLSVTGRSCEEDKYSCHIGLQNTAQTGNYIRLCINLFRNLFIEKSLSHSH